jgi:hypothetical protein
VPHRASQSYYRAYIKQNFINFDDEQDAERIHRCRQRCPFKEHTKAVADYHVLPVADCAA